MNGIARKMFYSCEEASKLTIQRETEKVSMMTKLRHQIHLMMCKGCRAFNIQNKWLNEKMHDHAHAHPDQKPSAEAKEKWEKAIVDNADGHKRKDTN